MFRDKYLENRIKEIINETKFREIIRRYEEHDLSVKNSTWPRHYPIRLPYMIGQIATGENIFMFLPEAAGISTGKEEDYFGFEFIDMWENIFTQIVFPCVKRIFDAESQLYFYKSLMKYNLAETIYLASVFHELGHRYGFWKVSPKKHENNNLSKYHLDIVGELWTDSLLASKLYEFDNIASFILLQRLFWFGRRGFSKNSLSANINADNDSWIGSYLWSKCLSSKTISRDEKGKWMINSKKIVPMFADIVSELEVLAANIMKSSDQDAFFKGWMQQYVETKNNIFILPESLRTVFQALIGVPETPLYNPQLLLDSKMQNYSSENISSYEESMINIPVDKI